MKEEFVNVVKGEIKDIDTCSDEVFADKALGDGVLILPQDYLVVSPCDGEVISVFPTKHAISILSDSGVEILIHIGIDTVELEGKGFEQLVQEHTKVTKFEPLMKVDYDLIRNEGFDPATLMIFTSKKDIKKKNLNMMTDQYIPVVSTF